jgi:hypothetical protein
VSGLIHARTGDDPAEITAEDREHFSEEELRRQVLSELLIAERLLPGSLDQLVERVEHLRRTAQ